MTGIIGAMESEVKSIYQKMTSKEEIKAGDLVFYKGLLCGKEVVVVKCGIGKVNAALCTQIFISRFNPQKIINTGIAGATGNGLQIYDFVVSTKAVYHDFDTTYFGYKLGQVPGMPETFDADKNLIDIAVKSFSKTELSQNHKIRTGIIASGDQFVSDSKKKNIIVENFSPECVEMEGTAIAHTCYKNDIPFVIIRCMSDCADDNVETVYDEEKASFISSSFLLELIKDI